MSKVWLNGEILEESCARLSPTERGFLYADGLFETFRLMGFKPCLADLHLERLANSAAYLKIPFPDYELASSIEALARAEGMETGVARLTLTRGAEPGSPRPGPQASPTVLITLRPGDPSLPSKKELGVAGRTLEHPLRGFMFPMQNHKTLSYLSSIIGWLNVAPEEEPILETTSWHLSEGAAANVFLVKNGALHTPSLDSGCLPGIARAVLLELAAKDNIQAIQRQIDSPELIEGDEAFLVNSVAGITPLVSLNAKPIGDGKPGPLTRRFSALLEEVLNLPSQTPSS